MENKNLIEAINIALIRKIETLVEDEDFSERHQAIEAISTLSKCRLDFYQAEKI